MKKLITIKNKYCRMCYSKSFFEVINLGLHPLVNSLVDKKNIKKKDPVFPIKVKQCRKCKLVQLTDIIDANEIYKNVDYLYFSSDMPGLDKYFKPYASELKRRFLKINDFVVEIGCNDGVMLKYFKSKYKVLGVDPATNVILRTLKKKIPSLPLFFSESLAEKVLKEWGPAKLIYGNNCIAHLNDLRDLIKGVHKLLTNDGIFILECNYWGAMVKNINYSLIYHDHFSYFSANVWHAFALKYKMYAFDAVITDAQGGSLRLFLSKNKRKRTERLKKILNEEQKNKLNTLPTSIKYKNNVIKISNKLRNIILNLKKENKKIAGYGAAAKGMTILKCSDIGKELMYFVDDSPAKQGFYSPVDHIPIISREQAEKNLPDYFIILAPNYSNEIMSKEAKFIKNGGKFIIPKNEISII
jgi:SAM-dependent methyltransferase